MHVSHQHSNQFLTYYYLQVLNHADPEKESGIFEYPDSAGEGVDVYVMDSGVDIAHWQFQGRAKHGADFTLENNHHDGLGHGTHVAGIIASTKYGVAKKVNIISVKVLDKNGVGDTASILKAAKYVVTKATMSGKPSILNLSMGKKYEPWIDELIKQIVASGIYMRRDTTSPSRRSSSRYSNISTLLASIGIRA